MPPNIALEPSALLKDERRGSARALDGSHLAKATEFLFGVAEVALLMAPIVVVLTWLGSRRRSGPIGTLVFYAVIPAALVVAAVTFETSFVDIRVNAVFLAVAYAGYCVAVGLLLSRPRSELAFSFGMAFLAPVLLGCLVGTVGVLAVGLIAAEYEPTATGGLGAHHRYLVTHFGSVASEDEGWRVGIYRTLGWAPFLERRVFSRRYVVTDSSEVRVEEQAGFRGALVRIGGQPPTTVPFD